MSEYTDDDEEIRLDENDGNKQSKDEPPPPEISTSRKHSVDYFTKDGFILRTGYSDIRDWYLFPIKESLDNAIDFLWKYCRGKNASVEVDIYKNDKLFRIRIRNPNPKDSPVFEDLDAIFDYGMRYGSKQDVHIISRGMLGDATKQILSLGYILLHFNDDGTEFTDRQWEYPLIIRHNKEECRIFLSYDKAMQEPKIGYEITAESDSDFTDTEVEVVLPIVDQVRNTLDKSYIEKFCREYSIITTDISFKFCVLDESTNKEREDYSKVKLGHISKELLATLSSPPSKGIVKIEVPALTPIPTSKEWNNADSIHSYLPGEFTSRITNIHHKQKIVYHALRAFREGTNIKKNTKTEKSIAELLSDPNMYAEIEESYHELKNALTPPKELSIPYTTNRKERVEALVPRIAEIYNIDKNKKPSYRIEWGYYDDGIVQYPSAFEILGIPFANPIEAETKFIGAINYSVSPNGIKFEGEYNTGGSYNDENINDVLRSCGFHKHSAKKSRLPCIIIGNLITIRRDPYGYDKSRIDTKPFAQTIVAAVKKMASGIPTLHSAGYIIRSRDDDYKNARQKKINRKVSAKELLRQFLVRERGLVDV